MEQSQNADNKFSYLFFLSSTTDILIYSACLCMACMDCRNALSV